MEWIAISWSLTRANEYGESLQIDRLPGRDDVIRYAVRRGGSALNKQGEFEYEPMPSHRTDEFYARCRFDTLEDAQLAAEKYLVNPPGQPLRKIL